MNEPIRINKTKAFVSAACILAAILLAPFAENADGPALLVIVGGLVFAGVLLLA